MKQLVPVEMKMKMSLLEFDLVDLGIIESEY